VLRSCGLRITAGLLLWMVFLGGQGVNALQPAGRQGTGKDSAVVAAKAQRPQEGKLKVGDLAPDFDLTVRGGEQKVRLSSFRGRKPVALVFGSYT